MHTEGPVREEIFEDNIKLKNLKNFMKKEGYEAKDIDQAIKDEKQR